MSRNTSSCTPKIHYEKKRWGDNNKFKFKIIKHAMHCFLHCSKAQYTIEKSTLENVFFETELRTDREVRPIIVNYLFIVTRHHRKNLPQNAA